MFFDRDNHEIDFSDSEHESGEETAFDKWKKAEYAKVAEAKREKEAAEAAAKEQAAQGDEDSVNMDELQRTAQYGNKTNKRSRSAMESTGSAGGGTAGDSVGAVADGAQAGGRKKRAREESSEPGSSLGGKPKKRKKKFKAELSRAGLRELMEKHDGRISSKDLIKAYKYKVKPGVPGFKENQAKFRQLISEILAKVDDGGGNIYYILKQK